MTRSPGVVRPATADDAAGIGPCHLACWQETYRELLSPASRRCYARNGSTPDGAREVLDSWEGLTEIRLVR